MQYRLYKLRFTTPVRFGTDSPGAGLADSSMTAHADTLFSALATEAALHGEDVLNRFVQYAMQDDLIISDLFPFQGERLFLPRPLLPPASEKGENRSEVLAGTKERKAWKQQKYLAINDFAAYMKWIGGGEQFNPLRPEFAGRILRDRINHSDEKPRPYMVTAHSFSADSHGAGLYFIAAVKDEAVAELLEKLLELLGYSGIGGKRSSGYGKFELYEDPLEISDEGVYEDDETLYGMLTAQEPKWYMTLSALWPREDEIIQLKDGYYQLIRRSGFVNSPSYAPQALKRNDIHMITAGSCFKACPTGQIGDVANGGAHPVYRYGKALCVGVG